MKFDEAESDIKSLFPTARLLGLSYDKRVQPGETTIECSCRVIISRGGDCKSFTSSTWDGVISKIKIFLVPNKEPTPEEAPNEVALCSDYATAMKVVAEYQELLLTGHSVDQMSFNTWCEKKLSK